MPGAMTTSPAALAHMDNESLPPSHAMPREIIMSLHHTHTHISNNVQVMPREITMSLHHTHTHTHISNHVLVMPREIITSLHHTHISNHSVIDDSSSDDVEHAR